MLGVAEQWVSPALPAEPREVNLTTEKGREEQCPAWLLKRAYLLCCLTAEISTLPLHLSVDVSRPTVPYV
jgi:hypothetical protein